LIAATLWTVSTGPVLAQQKPGPQEPYGLVGGTVFRDPGFTQQGAKVVLTLESQPWKKLQEQVSSPTGEFAFRVKAEPNRYTVTATLKGFEPASKTVEITGQEQVRATLMLIPESNRKER
jgi:hypothetical protein